MKSLVLLVFLLAFFLFFGCVSSSVRGPALPPRHLVIGLDGVGLKTMNRMYEGGYFREFYRPSAMVATFPSISDPNWAVLMNTPVSESYTKAFFDIHSKNSEGLGQAQGSLLNHLTSPPAYELGFDFKAEGAFQHLAVMTWTQTSALFWLDSMEKRFFETRGQEDFFAFFINPDILAHTLGERAILEYLSHLDRHLKRMRQRVLAEYGYELDVTIVSDHGNHWVSPQDIDFEEPLRKLGWSWVQTLSENKHYGYVAPEIIAFAAFYTLPGREADLAKDVSKLSTVDIAAFVSGPNQVDFFADASKSQTRIKVDPTKRTVEFKILAGKDHLGHANFFKNGPLGFEEYLNLTHSHTYPYAAVRLWEAFHRNVRTPASVLVSPKLGHVFSNKTLQMLTALRGLKGMHGSLRAEESLGVFMSTKDQTGVIRPEDFRKFVDLSRFEKRWKASIQASQTESSATQVPSDKNPTPGNSK